MIYYKSLFKMQKLIAKP